VAVDGRTGEEAARQVAIVLIDLATARATPGRLCKVCSDVSGKVLLVDCDGEAPPAAK
jgi:hypothetical protein